MKLNKLMGAVAGGLVGLVALTGEVNAQKLGHDECLSYLKYHPRSAGEPRHEDFEGEDDTFLKGRPLKFAIYTVGRHGQYLKFRVHNKTSGKEDSYIDGGKIRNVINVLEISLVGDVGDYEVFAEINGKSLCSREVHIIGK